MDRGKQIQRRIAKIKQALAALGDMRPGSLSVQTRSWGGQYHQLSYTHLGKGHTQYIPQNASTKSNANSPTTASSNPSSTVAP
jgi:hypothetical protein